MMKRRNFMQYATAFFAGSTLTTLKVNNDADSAGKTSLVGVGASGCRIAKAIAEALPYEVNHHTIASENSAELQGKGIVNCWYRTQLQSHFLADTTNYEKILAEDWAYNISHPYFQANLSHIQNRVVVIAGLGRTTGSYVSVQLIKELLKRIPAAHIQFVGTLPWKFASGKFKYKLAHQCLADIKATGIQTDVHDFESTFKGQNLKLDEAYLKMDKMLITSIQKNINSLIQMLYCITN